jgi:hypothetical protein
MDRREGGVAVAALSNFLNLYTPNDGAHLEIGGL